nr:mucin-17 [Bactrocera oleae]
MQLLWSNMYPQSELDNYKLQVDLLQEKLKQSEENRQQLQKELQQILQRRSEHDKSVRTKIRQKYQSFLDEQEHRNERNKMLMQMIERIDQQTTALSARSERLKMMKLQYERYFAKLMHAQPVRCIPNVMPTTRLAAETTPITALPASTQIPVLLPTVAAQAPTTAPPIGSLNSEVTTTPVPAIPILQPRVNHVEAMRESQPAALTPRMWTFAMATPTPAGLLLSGAPTTSMATGTLPTTATPYEFFQYPLGYGPIIQQHQLQQQASYAKVTPTDSAMAFGNRGDIPQSCNADMTEKKHSVPNEYELTNNIVPTAEAATSTEFPPIVDKAVGETAHKQTETMPHAIDRMEETGEMKESTYSPATAHSKPTHLTSTQTHEKLSRYQSDNTTSMKASVDNLTPVFKEPSSTVSEVINGVSAVKLEDADIMGIAMNHTNPAVTSKEPAIFARPSYNFEEDHNSTTAVDAFNKGNTIKLSTAEEHRRKIAEIEQRYGTIDTEANNGYANRNLNPANNESYIGFKRFSEIVNPKHESSAEQLPTSNENLDNQSWQSHMGSVENASMAPTSSMSSASKPLSSSKIDNIENAIYGELVNPQLAETEVTPIRTAAQGFFTELLEQQKTPLETNLLAESTTQEQEYTTNLSGITENTTIESGITGELKPENAINETTEPQTQTTYGTYNTEIYQPTNTFNAENAYSTAETANNYTDYPTEQNIEASSTDTTDQLQQEQQPGYSQQDYENYDATQYGNYDPNAYPGYIYDETTGQFVVDPQYTASDVSNAEAIYTIQDYTEPQEQQQEQPVQEVNYAYEDSNNATAAPVAIEQTALEAAATPTEPSSPAATVEAPVAPAVPNALKVVKPTSILSTAEKHVMQSDAQKKKKRVIFVDSSETDDSSSVKAPTVSAANAGNESDFDFSSGAETSVG